MLRQKTCFVATKMILVAAPASDRKPHHLLWQCMAGGARGGRSALRPVPKRAEKACALGRTLGRALTHRLPAMVPINAAVATGRAFPKSAM